MQQLKMKIIASFVSSELSFRFRYTCVNLMSKYCNVSQVRSGLFFFACDTYRSLAFGTKMFPLVSASLVFTSGAVRFGSPRVLLSRTLKSYRSYPSHTYPLLGKVPLSAVITARGAANKIVQGIRYTVTAAGQQAPVISPKASKWVGAWLIGCSGMVAGAVILGGITRLTKSGLSMVDWHLFKEFPPLSAKGWIAEFEKYQEYPDFKQRYYEMTLEEFKSIWYMEYLHRMWGRAVGAFFVLPAIFFWRKRWLSSGMKKRVMVFGTLILGQGLLGWYMVKSGLEEKPEADGVARVSQYRLAAHLGLALILYSLFLWSGLNHLCTPQQVPATKQLRRMWKFAHGTKSIIFLAAFSGALVAGTEAGLAYNSFPKMANRWIPSDILAYSPLWRNVTENPTTIQFNHRILGETVFCGVTALWLYSRRLHLPPRARLAVNCMFAVGLTQVCLGILTLIFQVPKPLAVSHQTGALTLLSMAVWLTHELKFLRRIPK